MLHEVHNKVVEARQYTRRQCALLVSLFSVLTVSVSICARQGDYCKRAGYVSVVLLAVIGANAMCCPPSITMEDHHRHQRQWLLARRPLVQHELDQSLGMLPRPLVRMIYEMTVSNDMRDFRDLLGRQRRMSSLGTRWKIGHVREVVLIIGFLWIAAVFVCSFTYMGWQIDAVTLNGMNNQTTGYKLAMERYDLQIQTHYHMQIRYPHCPGYDSVMEAFVLARKDECRLVFDQWHFYEPISERVLSCLTVDSDDGTIKGDWLCILSQDESIFELCHQHGRYWTKTIVPIRRQTEIQRWMNGEFKSAYPTDQVYVYRSEDVYKFTTYVAEYNMDKYRLGL